MGVPCLFVIQKRTFFCLTLLVSTIIYIYRQQWKFRGKCDGTRIDPYHSDQPSLKMKGSKEERDFWSSLDIWRTKMQNVSTPSTPLHQLVHKITPSINEKDDAWSKNTFKKRLTCDRINVYKQWRYLRLLLCSCNILSHELCDIPKYWQCHKVSTNHELKDRLCLVKEFCSGVVSRQNHL